MTFFKSHTDIPVYEQDGVEVRVLDKPMVQVHSHWNIKSFVVIETPDGKKYTVVADQLERAIRNGTNVPSL